MNKILDLIPYVGALMVAVGVVAGFFFMFQDNDDQAKVYLSLIPVGFLVLFVGVVTNMLRR